MMIVQQYDSEIKHANIVQGNILCKLVVEDVENKEIKN